MTDLPAELGRAIRHHRERAGLSQTALGEAVGRTVQAIGNMERGKSLPALGTLEAIAGVLGAPLREFFPPTPGTNDDAVNRVVSHLNGLTPSELESVEPVLIALVAAIRR